MELHVGEPWFSLIGVNSKLCEGRLAKNKYLKLKPKDRIVFVNNDYGHRKIFKKVIFVKKYNSFRDFLKAELAIALPTIKTINEGIAVYRKFYSEDDEKKYGVVSIHLI